MCCIGVDLILKQTKGILCRIITAGCDEHSGCETDAIDIGIKRSCCGIISGIREAIGFGPYIGKSIRRRDIIPVTGIDVMGAYRKSVTVVKDLFAGYVYSGKGLVFLLYKKGCGYSGRGV